MGKMVMFDLNNLAIRTLFTGGVGASSDNPDYQVWKYLIMNSIYWAIKKFKNVDEVVLAVDSKKSWRKLYFPRYKESRKYSKEDKVDWETVFEIFHEFHEDIKNHLPFKVLKVRSSEADDIIGVLTNNIKDKEIIIYSRDSDYLQCCGKNSKVYDPHNKKFMTCDDTERFITKKALMGQGKDDIFNAKTPLDYPKELRRPPLGEKKANQIVEGDLDSFLDQDITYNKEYTDENGEVHTYESSCNIRERFEYNKRLIDFRLIPDIIVERTLDAYYNYEKPHPDNMYQFFKNNQFTGFLEDFEFIEDQFMRLY